MFAKTIRTYERKRKFGNNTFYTSRAVPGLYNNVKHGNNIQVLNNECEKEINVHDISDYDPFDTTFDRLLKETKETNKPMQDLNYTIASRSGTSNSDDSINNLFREDIITTNNLSGNRKTTRKTKKSANNAQKNAVLSSAISKSTKKKQIAPTKKRNKANAKMTITKCHISPTVRRTRNKYKLKTKTDNTETTKLENNTSCYVRLTKCDRNTDSIKRNVEESHFQCNKEPLKNSQLLSKHLQSDEKDAIEKCKVTLTKMDTENITQRKKCVGKENMIGCFVKLTKISSLKDVVSDISSSNGNNSSKLEKEVSNSILSSFHESSMSNHSKSLNKLHIDEESIDTKYRKSGSLVATHLTTKEMLEVSSTKSNGEKDLSIEKAVSLIEESTRNCSLSFSSVVSKTSFVDDSTNHLNNKYCRVSLPYSLEKLDLNQIDFAASNSITASTPFIARSKVRNSLNNISSTKAKDSSEKTKNQSRQTISYISESDIFCTDDSEQIENHEWIEKTNEIVQMRVTKESIGKIEECDLCDTVEMTQTTSKNDSLSCDFRNSNSDSSSKYLQPMASRSLFSATDYEESGKSDRVDSAAINISTENEKSTNATEPSMETDTKAVSCSLVEDSVEISPKGKSITEVSVRKETKSMKTEESLENNNENAITRRLTTGTAQNAFETNLKEERDDFEKDVPIRKSLINSAISLQRRRYRGWDLTDISESINGDEENNSHTKNKSSSQPIPSSSCERSLKELSVSSTQPVTRGLFLKPGKNWMRSLSILSNIQNGHDLENLSKGKGRKWRQSVQDILNMQEDGILQSCLKDIDKDKEHPSLRSTTRDRESSNKRSTYQPVSSPNRFSRRFSIRIIPDSRGSKSIHNNSYLQAFTTQLDSHGDLPAVVSLNPTNERPLLRRTHSASIVKTPRDYVLERCKQKNYIRFAECFPDQYLERCQKIGEGVYGEVFLYNYQREKTVIKIIPIEGNELVNGEPQKKFEEILSEIVITEELHNLKFTDKYNTKSFVGVKKISCIQGRYPKKLIDLWNIYDEKKTSENDSPSMFQDEQLYITIELNHGGQDLESFVFRNAAECLAAFVQTSLALAVAEQSLEFEHRDLHWGNLLISRTRSSSIECKIDDKEIQCSTKGVQVAIIDFTLSRMSYKGYCIYNDLASDPALFTAQGNEYQFEIYRLMKDRTENNWQRFEPFTNILWLHYMIDKMLNMVNYKVEKKCAKMHKTYLTELEELKDDVLNYESAYDFVTNCDKICDILHTNIT